MKMKYLRKFNESEDFDFFSSIQSDEKFKKMNYFDVNYDAASKSVTCAYFLLEDNNKTIKVLNLVEIADQKGIFADKRVPYTFNPFKVDLPKSQIEILDEVDDMPGFRWIRLPYWLYKKNESLKINRLSGLKRFTNSGNLNRDLKPEMIDDDVIKYISVTDKDRRTIINLETARK